jgi:hypothetical protein
MEPVPSQIRPTPEPEPARPRPRPRPKHSPKSPKLPKRRAASAFSALRPRFARCHLRVLGRLRMYPQMKHRHAIFRAPAAPRATQRDPACKPVPQEAQDQPSSRPVERRLGFGPRRKATLSAARCTLPSFICLTRASTATCRRSVTRGGTSRPYLTVSSRARNALQAVFGNGWDSEGACWAAFASVHR